MKILLINDLGTPTGGAETFMLLLRNTLRELGHDARLFSGSARPTEAEVVADDTCFASLNSALAMPLKIFNPFAVRKLQKILADFQPDVVHIRLFLDQLSPAILEVTKKYPTLLHICDYRPICPINTKVFPSGKACHETYGTACLRECVSLPKWLPLMAQMKLLFRKEHGARLQVVACSDWVKQRLEEDGVTVHHVVWNGATPADESPSLMSLSPNPTLAYAGRFVWKKGVDTLLQSLPLIRQAFPKVQLNLIGYGPEGQRLRALSKSLNLGSTVVFQGHKSRSELEAMLRQTWLQILPSRWEEPFGNVMIEAMLRGSVFVAPQYGAPVEVLQHNVTGILFSPYTPEALAKAIIGIMQSKERINTIRASAYQFATTHLRLDTQVGAYVDIYKNMSSIEVQSMKRRK